MFDPWLNSTDQNLEFLLKFHPEQVIRPALDRER